MAEYKAEFERVTRLTSDMRRTDQLVAFARKRRRDTDLNAIIDVLERRFREIQDSRLAISRTPQIDADMHAELGRLNFLAYRYPAVIEHMETALEINPQHQLALKEYARFLRDGHSDYERSEAYTIALVESDGETPTASSMLELGYLYRNWAKKIEEEEGGRNELSVHYQQVARGCFGHIVNDIDPDYRQAVRRLAQIERETGMEYSPEDWELAKAQVVRAKDRIAAAAASAEAESLDLDVS